MLKPCVVVVFVFMIYILYLTSWTESRMTITNLTLCKGPKRKDCAITSVRVLNTSLLVFEMQILQDVVPEKAKLTCFINGKLLARLHVKKPCDHLFFKPLYRLSMSLNVPKNCNFKKGNQTISYNMDDVMRHVGLNDHLKGNFSTEVVFYTDDCNISCFVFEAEITQ